MLSLYLKFLIKTRILYNIVNEKLFSLLCEFSHNLQVKANKPTYYTLYERKIKA
jgi:hypothetical protein